MSSIDTRLRVDQVGEEPRTLALRPARGWIEGLELGVEGEIDAPLRIDLVIYRSGEEVFAEGRVEGRVGFPCYRCLEPAAAPLSGSFRVTYLPAPAEIAGARRSETGEAPAEDMAGAPDPGDVDVYYHVDGVFDLLPMLREQILVALPHRALCGENCKGLCPSCGADLNAGNCDCSAQSGFSKFGKLRDLRFRQ